jgi:hypothetical protein
MRIIPLIAMINNVVKCADPFSGSINALGQNY